MDKIKKAVAVLLMLTMVLLTGCTSGVEVVWSLPVNNSTVFKIEDRECSVSTARLLLANYKNLYSEAYGDNIWEQEEVAAEIETYLKEATLSQLAKIETMCLLAAEQGVTLSSEETKAVREAAKAYEKSLQKGEAEELKITYSDIEEFYMEYALATKLYVLLTGGINEEVSDDDARVMGVMQIVVKDKETADKVQKRIAAGSDFKALANYYSVVSESELNLYWQNLRQEQKDALSLLSEGEVSASIRVEDKYYIYKCVTKIDRELTEENKGTIVKQRATEAFDDVYEAFKEGCNSTFNDGIWKTIKIDFSEKVVTKSLFSTFEEYCGNMNSHK